MEKVPIEIWGAWIYKMFGDKPKKGEKLPKEGWQLLHVVPGKFSDISELSQHYQNYADLDDYCVLIMHGDNTGIAYLKE